MEIVKATLADIPPIMALIRAAVKAMNDGGLHQWNEEYPNQEIITDDINAHSLFKITTDGKIAGVVALNHQYFPEYNALTWDDSEGKFLMVHRLCVDPEYQGKGLAKALMQFAEEYALKNGYTSIRLDTSVSNKAALGLYDGTGYRRAGIVRFKAGDFQVFENMLFGMWDEV